MQVLSAKRFQSCAHRVSITWALGIVCVSLLVPFVIPFRILGAGWWDEVGDIAHFVSFGVIALMLYKASGYWISDSMRRLTLVFSVMALLAALSEFIQFYLHAERNGSLNDVIRNCMGALSFVCIVLGTKRLCRNGLKWTNLLALVIGLAIAAEASIPLVEHWQIRSLKQENLPIIHDFSNDWEWGEISWANARPATSWQQGVAEFIYPNNDWGGVRLNRPWADWGVYSSLFVDLDAQLETSPLLLTIYIVFVDDLIQRELNWAVVKVNLTSGRNQISIPFSSIRYENKAIDFEQAKIKFVDFAKNHRDEPLSLTLNRVQLMK